MIWRFITGVFLALGLTACETSMGAAQTETKDAIRSQPGQAGLAELRDVISAALGGRPVLLAEDVLTQQAELIIDPKYVNDRSLQRPDHFRLQMAGKSCFLLHVETRQSYALKKVRCTAVS